MALIPPGCGSRETFVPVVSHPFLLFMTRTTYWPGGCVHDREYVLAIMTSRRVVGSGLSRLSGLDAVVAKSHPYRYPDGLLFVPIGSPGSGRKKPPNVIAVTPSPFHERRLLSPLRGSDYSPLLTASSHWRLDSEHPSRGSVKSGMAVGLRVWQGGGVERKDEFGLFQFTPDCVACL